MPVRIPVVALVLVLGLTVGVVASAVWSRVEVGAPAGVPMPAAGSERPAAGAAPDVALTVLQDWDARRAAAWAAGDVRALRRLYVEGAAAGRADARLLRRYLARGLVVRGMRTQVLAARVLTRRPRLLRLEVTDRLAAAVAVPAGAPDDTGRRLPAADAAAHVVVLRRVSGRWLVAGVTTGSSGGAAQG